MHVLHHVRLALAALGLLAAPVVAQSPARPPAPTAATIALAPYGPAHMRTVKVNVAGETYDFLFDTGGGVTVVSPAIAAKLGCADQGRTQGHRMFGEYLESPLCRDVALSVDGQPVRVEAAVMELKPYGDMPVPPVHGMISLHTFAGRALTLDLPNDRVVVESPATLSARVRTLTPLRTRMATGMNGGHLTLYVGVPAGGADLWMLWDSGNQVTTFVSPFAGARLSLADSTPDRASGVVSLALAPGLTVRTPVASKRIVRDGVLSVHLLSRAVWTADLATGRLWVGPIRPLLEPPATVAAAAVVPPRQDPTGWYDIALIVGAERQAAVLHVERAGAGLAARMRFVNDDGVLTLRNVRASGDSLTFDLPMRQTYPVRLAFRDAAGTGTWGDPATRGGAVDVVKVGGR